jgi:hypothetical protein
MPIQDHFSTEARQFGSWEGLHSAWLVSLTRNLNRRWLPEGYRAEPQKAFGPNFDTDVGIVKEPGVIYEASPGARTYQAPHPDATLNAAFAPHARVRIDGPDGRLVAAIEFVSPGNKDQPRTRDAFVGKIEAYLQSGVNLAIVDVVTSRKPNLHDHWADLYGGPECPRCADVKTKPLYVTGYRPRFERLGRHRSASVDVWLRSFAVGDELPTPPLYLNTETAVPVELELTYQETRADLRLPLAA